MESSEMNPKRILVAFTFFVLCVNPASAKDWAGKDWMIDSTKSTLGFVGTEDGREFQGSFRAFTAAITLDPMQPTVGGKIRVDVETGSATTGNSQKDSMMPAAEWFNAKLFPTAVFESRKVMFDPASPPPVFAKSQPPKFQNIAYLAEGTLDLKGVKKPVTLRFLLSSHEGGSVTATGEATLTRTDFKIGDGPYASDKPVGFTVKVPFVISAAPAGKKN
jgi:polyisoprenoid-binding protein YceI